MKYGVARIVYFRYADWLYTAIRNANIVIGGLNKNCHNCNVTLLVQVNPKRLKVYITGYQYFKSSDPAFHRVARIGRSG